MRKDKIAENVLKHPTPILLALKIWNAVELSRFLKANLNPVVADVEATSDDCETTTLKA